MPKKITTRTQSRVSISAQMDPRLFLEDHRDDPVSTLAGKAALIISLCNNMRASFLEKLDNIPADWDGHELRAWMGEKWAHEAITNAMKTDRRRMRKFRNDLLTKNL